MEYQILKSNKGQILEGLLLLKPTIFRDSRGLFLESWNEKKLNKILNRKINFVQDNHSKSFKGVLRGLHYQKKPYAQAKLIRCINGEIFDVAVDLRQNSKTFCQWAGIKLDALNHHQLWIPEGFAHGFLTLSKEADVLYKTNQFWMPAYEGSLKWNDPEILINWQIKDLIPILSNKDNDASLLENVDTRNLW